MPTVRYGFLSYFKLAKPCQFSQTTASKNSLKSKNRASTIPGLKGIGSLSGIGPALTYFDPAAMYHMYSPGEWIGCYTGNRKMGRIVCTSQFCPFLCFLFNILSSHPVYSNRQDFILKYIEDCVICAAKNVDIVISLSSILVGVYRAEKKYFYVLLSNSQAGPDRNFSQPCTNTFSRLCMGWTRETAAS